MIGIVDYNAGNITSVGRALKNLGIEYILSKNPSELENCDKIIFPGVGDAAYAMNQLKKTGFDEFLINWNNNKKPILGICLGSQIIFDWTEEGNTNCLGLIKGKIKNFYTLDKNLKEKVPQIGWNNLTFENGVCPLLKNIPENTDFYFVHSYVICPDDFFVVKATTDYGVKVPAIIQQENLFACQFHPEKSGEFGLKILKNFCEL